MTDGLEIRCSIQLSYGTNNDAKVAFFRHNTKQLLGIINISARRLAHLAFA